MCSHCYDSFVVEILICDFLKKFFFLLFFCLNFGISIKLPILGNSSKEAIVLIYNLFPGKK